ncbi:MAG: translation initiation factor IF-2 [Hyphomicrobium sp.]|jgi:translation initiation factor IF-2
MGETKDTADKSLAGGRKPLSLQRTVESGHVRQSFSHGRSKSVVVEKRKTRKLAAPGGAPERETQEAPAAPIKVETKLPERVAPRPEPKSDAGKSDFLRPEERDARLRALEAARRQAADDAIRAESERQAQAKAAAEAAAKAEAEMRSAAPAAPIAPLAEAQKPAAAEAPAAPAAVAAPPLAPAPAPSAASSSSRPAAAPAPAARAPQSTSSSAPHRPAQSPAPSGEGRPPYSGGAPRPQIRAKPPGSFDTRFAPREGGRPKNIELPRAAAPPASDRGGASEPTKLTKEIRPRPVAVETSDDDEARVKRGPGGKVVRVLPVKPVVDDRRERGKLTINNALDEQQRERSLASLKRKREREKLKAMGIQQPRDKIVREVVIPEAITIQELSNRMTERAVDLIKFLMKEGAMHKITDVIDADTAELIVQEFGHTPKRVSEADVETGFIGDKDEEESLRPRAPVVTIMGHVDHGKTSLLDAIRQTNVVSGEAGGITQHIGAYQVTTPMGTKVTFIDTPGHAAFTAMRARGAKVTDIVVLVVAADDGVMPQTVEAINHAKAAGVPIIVAINKIDKPQSDPNRVRTELLQHEIVVESMGGETLEVPVSALKRTNLDKLLEGIHLQAEILELKSNPHRSAEGIVIEAKLERGRGPVGTVLVQRGSLHVGDIVVAGSAWGRVRALVDDKGENVAEAGPSVPVEVLGFSSAPEAGDQIAVVENEQRAREITDYRIRKRRETLGAAGTARTLEQMMQQLKEAGKKEFPLVVKGDVQGSVEAIAGALDKLGTSEVGARIVHSAVGGITESDIALAVASKAIVIGFNVRANTQAKQFADSQGVEIRYYNIIYDLVDDVKAAMSGLLAPTKREVFLGYATIKQVFNVSKAGKVAGCLVTDGKVERGAKVRLLRDKVVIHEGTLSILKRFKDEVREVPAGQECGMAFANYQDIREGDEIECFQVETIKRSL